MAVRRSYGLLGIVPPSSAMCPMLGGRWLPKVSGDFSEDQVGAAIILGSDAGVETNPAPRR